MAAVALYTLLTDYFKRSLIFYVGYLWNVKAAIIQMLFSFCDNPYLVSPFRTIRIFQVANKCVFVCVDVHYSARVTSH